MYCYSLRNKPTEWQWQCHEGGIDLRWVRWWKVLVVYCLYDSHSGGYLYNVLYCKNQMMERIGSVQFLSTVGSTKINSFVTDKCREPVWSWKRMIGQWYYTTTSKCSIIGLAKTAKISGVVRHIKLKAEIHRLQHPWEISWYVILARPSFGYKCINVITKERV